MTDHAPPGEQEWFDDDAGPLVRLYGVTRGRTGHAAGDLSLLSVVVSRTVPAAGNGLGPEHLEILRLCRTPRVVIEIGADLNLPVGVLYVLLVDLEEQRLITVRPPNRAAERPDEPLLEELLNGLQSL